MYYPATDQPTDADNRMKMPAASHVNRMTNVRVVVRVRAPNAFGAIVCAQTSER